MKIEWEQRVRVSEGAPLSLVAACCQVAEGVTPPLAVHVVVTDDVEIRELNARTRGVDRATDVLSFPTEWVEPAATAQPAPSALLASPAPETAESGMIAAEDLPWRKLLEPGALLLPDGVALQQLMFVCPAQIRSELAALGGSEAGAAAQARVCTLGEHLAAVQGGKALTACLLMPAVSDRVRYAALGRDGEDARAFIGMLASDGWQARAAEGALVPAIAQGGGGDALTRAASERFSQGMTLPNAFAHTADELQSLCLDAFLRAADPVETLLRLR